MSQQQSAVKKIFGNLSVITVLGYMGLLYFTFLYANGFAIPEKSTGLIVHLVAMHMLLALFLISYFQTILRDPGRVPLFWGFFIDDADTKTRRYCLICHIFKPERCHHCSACNRCVLNMDHHCPWLNNCIGFYNRKYFILLLFYALVLKLEAAIFYLPIWARYFKDVVINSSEAPAYPDYLTIAVYILNAVMLCVLTIFFKFHVKLIIENLTTLEQMDRKRDPLMQKEAINYDMGVYYNFIQIFGRNKLFWFLPFDSKQGQPVGDGVVWPQKPTLGQTYEIDMSIQNIHRGSEGGFDKSTTGREHNITPQQHATPHKVQASVLNFQQVSPPLSLQRNPTLPDEYNKAEMDNYNSRNPNGNFSRPPALDLRGFTNIKEESTGLYQSNQSANMNIVTGNLSTYQTKRLDVPLLTSNSTQRQNYTPNI